MKEFSDDELADNVTVANTKTTTTAPAAPAAATATATATAPAPVAATDIEDNLPQTASVKPPVAKSYSWDDEKLGNEGDGLARIRPDKDSDRSVRFAILPGPLFAHRQHWIATAQGGKSCRLCLSEDGTPAWCCDRLGEDSRMRIIAPGLQYLNTNPDGSYPRGAATEVRLGFVDLSPGHFKMLRQLSPEGDTPVPVTDLDVGMTYEKKRYGFRLICVGARWKKIPELKARVEADLARLLADGGRRLAKRLGKPTSLAEWKALLASRGAEPTLDDVEEL